MLKDKKNDLLYLLSMLESLEKVITYGRSADKAEDFYEYNDQVNFNKEGLFNKDELAKTTGSHYYRHVDFSKLKVAK